MPDPQVERLEEVCAGFEQHVAPDDAAVGDPVLHVDGHVGRFDEDQAVRAALVFDRQPPRPERRPAHADAGARQQPQRLVLHSPFRHRDG
jgi:hypothetical protein